jgi:hypothetical protein
MGELKEGPVRCFAETIRKEYGGVVWVDALNFKDE